MKKFYTIVTSEKSKSGYKIHLDGRPLKTPAQNAFYAPNQHLSDLVIKEWAAQEDTIKPDTMPITQILSTQIDRIGEQREILTPELTKYLNTDLICYFADRPPELVEKQKESWNPWHNWFEKNFGEALKTTDGLAALTQNNQAHENVLKHIKALNDAHFTILQMSVPASGSLVLGLAFTDQAIDSKTLFKAVRVEENFKAALYNEEKYGPDPAQNQKDEALKRDLAAAETILKSLTN